METRPMKENSAAEGRFSYVHEVRKRHSEAIDIHHIFLRKTGFRFPALSAYGSITLSLFLFILFKLDSITRYQLKIDSSVALWILTPAAFIWIHHRRKQVERESVIIFPSLGVQLEIVYGSGKKVRRFVPMGKILKPVLNECVTPVTCYWSLSLILRDDEELLLVFKDLYPPVTMLRPIWEALLAATEQENRPEEDEEEDDLSEDTIKNSGSL